MILQPRVKICCISSKEEAALAIGHGAHILGFVAEQPSGPGIVDDDTIRDIVRDVPSGVSTFLLTSRIAAAEIADHVAYCCTDSVQLVQHIDVAAHEKLDQMLPPNIRRIQVIHVQDETALDLIDLYTPFVDAYLLDSGRPTATIAEFGGTGRTHDWAISAKFVARSTRPVFLAGGLNAGNIANAIRQVRPYGLDLCSGVRTEDRLCEKKLADYFSAVRAAL